MDGPTHGLTDGPINATSCIIHVFVEVFINSTPFFFIRTPNFSPRLDVLIFSAISASNVLIDVLNHFSLKVKYLYSTTVYLILNITVFSLSYNMN